MARNKIRKHMQRVNKARNESERNLVKRSSQSNPLSPEKAVNQIGQELRQEHLKDIEGTEVDEDVVVDERSGDGKPDEQNVLNEGVFDNYGNSNNNNHDIEDIFVKKKKTPHDLTLQTSMHSSADVAERYNFGRKSVVVDGCIASPRMSLNMERTVQLRERRSLGFSSWMRTSFANLASPESRRTPRSSNTREPNFRPQYRIRSKEKVESLRFWTRIKDCLCCRATRRFEAFTYDSLVGGDPWSFLSHLDPNRVLVGYLSWSFRTSFSILFLSLSIGFFALIIIFAFIMMILGSNFPTCFQPNFNEANTPFADAYALSWTTFTTVGYGHTYPSKSTEEPNQAECFWLHILCSFESFIGVLFAGICGAIIFGKVTRIQSLAPIVFSDPITVRYGLGLIDELEDEIPDGKIPCPILTFRLANLHSDRVGGEVVDSLINVMGIFNSTIENRDYFPRGDNSNHNSMHYDEFEDSDDLEQGSYSKRRKRRSTLMLSSSPRRMTINEDPGSSVNILRTFHKISIDTSENPYFKRTWTVNHILDSDSPLLLPHIRKAISENGEYWPPYLNDADSVRECIQFSQIFVSVSGISVVCADSVYAQHLYNYMDMNIGYQFVPILYTSDSLDIKVDFDTLNDVVEQEGGGGENFYDDDSQTNAEAEEYKLSKISGTQMIMPLSKEYRN